MLTFLAEEGRHQGMPELASFLLTLYNLVKGRVNVPMCRPSWLKK